MLRLKVRGEVVWATLGRLLLQCSVRPSSLTIRSNDPDDHVRYTDRTMIRLHHLLIAMLLLLFAAQGERRAYCDDHAAAELLIQQLRSSSRAKRIEAERELIDLGEGVLPHFRNLNHSDPALSFHLKQIEEEIRLRLAMDTLNGTLVTLQNTQPVALEQLTKTLTDQASMSVGVDSRLRNLPVQVEVNQQPFWKVIDELSQQADVGWSRDRSGVTFAAQALLKYGATDYPKCFRVAAIHHAPRKSFRRRLRQNLVRISFRVDVEPVIVPYFLTVRDRHFELRSSDNQTLSPFNPDAVREIPLVAQPWFEFTVDFHSESEVKANEFELDGEVELFCAARTTQIEVPLNDEEQTDARVQFVSKRSNTTEQRVVADIFLPEGSEQFDSHRLALLHQDAWRVEEGQNVPARQTRIVEIDGQKHRVEFVFPKAIGQQDQATFIYNYPDLFTSLPVSFKIRGIESSAKK